MKTTQITINGTPYMLPDDTKPQSTRGRYWIAWQDNGLPLPGTSGKCGLWAIVQNPQPNIIRLDSKRGKAA